MKGCAKAATTMMCPSYSTYRYRTDAVVIAGDDRYAADIPESGS